MPRTPHDPRAVLVRRQRWMVATAVLVLDAAVLLGYLAHLTPYDIPEFSRGRWNGDRDGSVIELVGQVQLVLAVVFLLFVARIRRAAVHAAWSLVLLTVLLDDLLRLHERGGQWIRTQWALPELGGLRAQDLGELAIWAAIAIVVGPTLLVTHLRAGRRDRRDSLVLLSLMGLLAVFAVGVDMVHVVLTDQAAPLTLTGLSMLETAGELVPLSLMLMAAHAASLAPDPVSTTDPEPAVGSGTPQEPVPPTTAGSETAADREQDTVVTRS